MKLTSFEAIVRALNEAGVHYLVVGGARAYVGSAPDDPPARFLALPSLIVMKEEAARPSDLNDAGKLRIIAGMEKS